MIESALMDHDVVAEMLALVERTDGTGGGLPNVAAGLRGYITGLRSAIAALEADNAALLIEADGQCEACAGEDTVEIEGPDGRPIGSRPCPLHETRRAHPGAALLAEHAKELVLARNEGREQVAQWLAASWGEHELSERARALKEPEKCTDASCARCRSGAPCR